MSRKARWHDRSPEMAQAVNFFSSLPDDLQTILGNTVLAIADKEFRVHELLDVFKSLGHEKILGLHQSKKKRRKYDNNPTLHKAINCIYVLPEEQQQWLGNELSVLIKYVAKYLEAHKANGVSASVDSLKVLTEAFVNGGPAETEKVLDTVTSNLVLQRLAVEKERSREGLITRKTHDMAIARKEDPSMPKKAGK